MNKQTLMSNISARKSEEGLLAYYEIGNKLECFSEPFRHVKS